MNPKGVKLLALRSRGNRSLVYVYREKQLAQNLNRPGVARFLKQYGYENTEPEQCLALLKKRFEASEDFPHEIGIFLDYPLGDVIGFIQNGGQNYKCSGCWKVYCNECETRKLLQNTKNAGKSIEDSGARDGTSAHLPLHHKSIKRKKRNKT